MSAMEVRGTTLDGRYVSSAACEMLSRPTNEMIASDAPSSRLPVVGQWNCIAWMRMAGCHANAKPAMRMSVSLTTSTPAITSLMRDDCRTPMTLSTVRKIVTASTHTKYQP